MTDQIAFHESEMKRHFEAGRFASARWHCRIWTRLVARKYRDDDKPVTRDVTQDKNELRGE